MSKFNSFRSSYNVSISTTLLLLNLIVDVTDNHLASILASTGNDFSSKRWNTKSTVCSDEIVKSKLGISSILYKTFCTSTLRLNENIVRILFKLRQWWKIFWTRWWSPENITNKYQCRLCQKYGHRENRHSLSGSLSSGEWRHDCLKRKPGGVNTVRRTSTFRENID